MKTRIRPILAAVSLLATSAVRADVYTVTSTNDSGAGSLRAAILSANAHDNALNPDGARDEIVFNILPAPAAGSWVSLLPFTPLPVITDAVFIDGTTQPGYNSETFPLAPCAAPAIMIDGVNHSAWGLRFGAGAASRVLGLSIVRCGNESGGLNWSAIHCDSGGAGGHEISACFIGMTPGQTRQTNTIGVWLWQPGCTVRQCVISGHTVHALVAESPAHATAIRGCWFGLNPDGTSGRDEALSQLEIRSNSNIIGTVTQGNVFDGLRRLISLNRAGGGPAPSGNTIEGNDIGLNPNPGRQAAHAAEPLLIDDAQNTIIRNNRIHSHSADEDHSGDAIHVRKAYNIQIVSNVLGGEQEFPIVRHGFFLGHVLDAVIINNTIWECARQSIFVSSSGGVDAQNVVMRNNEIHVLFNNGLGISTPRLAIDHHAPGEAEGTPTPNDPLDADSGPNGLLNSPVIVGVTYDGVNTLIQWTFQAAPGLEYQLDFHEAAAGPNQLHTGGFTTLQNVAVTTDAAGLASGVVTVPGDPSGKAYNALATRHHSGFGAGEGTSEYSPTYHASGRFLMEFVPGSEVTEGDSGPFLRIVREQGTLGTGGPMAIELDNTNAVVLGADFTSDPALPFVTTVAQTRASFSFMPGQTERTFSFSFLNDGVAEPPESLEMYLVRDWLYVANRITILDTTGPVTRTVTSGTPQAEGQSAIGAVNLSHPVSDAITVEVQLTLDGTAAAADVDRVLPATIMVPIPAGSQSAAFFIPTVDDLSDEEDAETFTATIVGGTSPAGVTFTDSAPAILSILDNDAPPQVFLGEATSVGEGGLIRYAIRLTAPSERLVKVDCATAAAAATAPAATPGEDFAEVSTAATFPPGTTQQFVFVSTVDDAALESNEHLGLSLSDPLNATLIPGGPDGLIIDNDAPTPQGVIRFRHTGSTVVEGGIEFIALERVGGFSGTVTVDVVLDLAGTTAQPSDYLYTPRTVTFADGDATTRYAAQIVEPVDDSLWENSEAVMLKMQNITGGAILDAAGRHLQTITDNDDAPTLIVSDFEVIKLPGASGIARFDIALSAPAGRSFVINAALRDGTARLFTDYNAGPSTLTIAPGLSSIFVNAVVLPWQQGEDAETFHLDLTPAHTGIVQSITCRLVPPEIQAPTFGPTFDRMAVPTGHGQTVRVRSSTDLTTWSTGATFTGSLGEQTVSLPHSGPRRFYLLEITSP
jgi:hypothetical protein